MGAGGTGGGSAQVGAQATGSTTGTGGHPAVKCDFNGTWAVAYESTDTTCTDGALNDVLAVVVADGEVEVTFEGDGPQEDTCGERPYPGFYTATAHLEGDGCVLVVSTSSKWCSNFEDQCMQRDLTLAIEADPDQASGALTYGICWSCGGRADEPGFVDYTAIATRQ
jgi:hypothetical protein